MTATNHVVTGAVLAAAIPHPVVLPLAIASHFVLDALPHFGNHSAWTLNNKYFHYFLIGDMALAAAFLITLSLLALPHWPLMVSAGILAASPDLMWVPGFFRAQKGQHVNYADAKNRVMRFHVKIQRWQIPRGLVVELVWLGSMLSLFGWLSARLLFRS